MRRRIVWLVAATTSAVVVAFIVPLCILIANLAEDRATSRVQQQAQNVATLVAAQVDHASLDRTVTTLSADGPSVSVILADGSVLGPPVDGAAAHPSVLRARATQTAFRVHVDTGLEAVVPVQTATGLDVVVATVSTADLRAGVDRAWVTIVLLGVTLIALALLIARELGRRISTPVTALATTAHRIQEGDVAVRAELTGPPEAIEVAGALNRLAERIEVLLAAEREHAADLGHRLRTPVTALRIDTDLVSDPDVAERLRDHIDHLQRGIDTVVRDARRSSREAIPADAHLVALVGARVDFWRPLAEDQDRPLSFSVDLLDPSAPVIVTMARGDLEELIDTLLDNVFAHTPEGAAIAVRLRTDATRAHIAIADGGPGITECGEVARGSSGSGSTGLGLDIVTRLAEGAGGSLTLGRAPEGGLAVEVDIPLRG